MLIKKATLKCILKQRVPFADSALTGIRRGKKVSEQI